MTEEDGNYSYHVTETTGLPDGVVPASVPLHPSKTSLGPPHVVSNLNTSSANKSTTIDAMRPLASFENTVSAAKALLSSLPAWHDAAPHHTAETPRRLASMLLEMTTRQEFKFTTFPNDGIDEMVTLGPIEFHTLCVGPRSRVHTTTRGTVRIHDVQEGEQIWTSVGGALVPTTVKSKSVTKKRKRVSASGEGFSLQLSEDHPVLTQRGYVLAGELQEGDTVPYHNSKQFSRKRISLTLGYSLGYVLGAVASDGYIESAMHKRRCSLAVREEWFAKRFALHVQEALGLTVEVRHSMKAGGFIPEPRDTWTVQFFEIDAIDKLLRLMGGNKRWNTVRLPDIVRSDAQIMQGYLDGYHDGDGTSYTNKDGYTIDKILSNNPDILNDLYQVGVASKPYIHSTGQGQVQLLKRPKFSPDPDIAVDLDSWGTELRTITEVIVETAQLKSYTMYELTCDPYPSFIVNGVPTHNCAHHTLPFYGNAYVGYVPDGKLAGLSKFARAVEYFAKGFHVQEELTQEIANFLEEQLAPRGVAVVMKAEHLCMAARGAKAKGVITTTSSMKGVFADHNRTAKSEFLATINGSH